MPSLPASMCADCTKRATVGRWCDDHQTSNQQIDNRRIRDRFRTDNDPFHAMYKGRRWLCLRPPMIHRQPLCADCGNKPSTVVDHIVRAKLYVANHGNDMEFFYDTTNLQGLCKQCHDAKTRRGE